MVTGLLVVTISWLWGSNSLALFDWDEINFAEIAREMRVSGDYLQPTVNFLPFHEKPPLFAWLQVLSYALWGVGSLGARFPNALAGLATVGLLWYHGRREGPAFAAWWVAFLVLSVLPALYFRSGIIDPWFNFFILAALLPALTGVRPTPGNTLAAGAWLGLAVLTKGPAAGLIAGLCWLVLLVMYPGERRRRAGAFLATGLLALLPLAAWVLLLWREDDGYFAREFLRYQWRLFFREDAGHGGFPGFHAVVLLLGCFPASGFALPLLWGGRGARVPGPDRRAAGMRILFWVVLLLFSVVSTKIVHYSSLAYVPLAYCAARWVTAGPAAPRTDRWLRRLRLGIWGLYALVALALPLVAWWLPGLLPRLTDPELVARLRLPVAWPAYTLLPGLLLAAGLVALARLRHRPRHRRAAAHLLLAFLFVTTALPVFAPRLQRYSQGAAVDFFDGLAGRDVYLGTAYYKSYAPWFYGRVLPATYRAGCRERDCRFHGATTKPLYFSSPLRVRARVLREVPDARFLYASGGFAFYLRPPAAKQ